MSEELGVSELVSIFEYQGFDAKAFKRTLKSLEQDAAAFDLDIKILVIFIAVRGTKIQKAMLKMKPEGVSVINEVKAKYGISDSKPNTPNDVTLARIAACFPDQLCQLYKSGHGRIVGNIPRGLSQSLCHPSAASVIPRSFKKTFKLWCRWRKSFSAVINNGKSKKEDSSFDRIIHESSLFSEEERRSIMENLNIHEEVDFGGEDSDEEN